MYKCNKIFALCAAVTCATFFKKSLCVELLHVCVLESTISPRLLNCEPTVTLAPAPAAVVLVVGVAAVCY